LAPRKEPVVKEARSWRSVRVLNVRRSLVPIVLLVAGCNYWGRRRLDQPTPIKPDNPVWIWSGGKVEKWHAVVITPDSVSGIAYKMPVTCYSCRLTIPRTRVDSMKLGYRTLPEDVTGIVSLTALGLLADVVVCTLVAPQDREC
jgi:hypothetical protein